MSHGVLPDGHESVRFPRVSGDEPAGDRVGIALQSFSPRERG